MAGVGLAAVLGGLVAATWGYLEALAQRDRAETALAQAEAVGRFLAEDLLAAADIETRADGGSVTVREMLERARDTVGQRFAGEPLVEAGVRVALGQSLRGLGEREAAVEEFSRALMLRCERLGADDPLTLESAQQLASMIHHGGDFEAARRLYEDTLARRQARLGHAHGRPSRPGTGSPVCWR